MTTTTNADYDAPPAAATMRRVTQAEFFAAVGPRDVHPRPIGPYRDGAGYTTEWRMNHGFALLVGVSDGGTSFCPSRYWLAE